ncbi:hypothetical protein HSR122_2196 [Halapricum desulfuricans]|uniref:Uncharacterized protein n=1 Tax=Halapricum desulfuricans TaxID=2841257 RepID=A0A897NA53_9EURY|nr:hypothetical protein HSR122_2178 [Halapricum desulfuricans]QSG09577.1 hypothetical protein HSR122_2196 [Halapricum desulfuricans]
MNDEYFKFVSSWVRGVKVRWITEVGFLYCYSKLNCVSRSPYIRVIDNDYP